MLRRSPRALGLWAGAITLGAATAALVAGDLAALHGRVVSLGPERSVVVARAALPLGATVTPADVATRRLHSSQLPDGVLERRSDAIGRVVRVPVVRDAFVQRANLAPRRRTGLAGVLPEGTRAARIDVEHGLRPPPGSAVDVFVSYASGSDALGTGRRTDAGATLVVAGAVVLETASDGVTLLVDADRAAALAEASAGGTLFLALAPPEDAVVPSGFRRR